MSDLISRQAAIDAVLRAEALVRAYGYRYAADALRELPAAQPFHNTTMGDVLKYIDDMTEDEWQEFTACLECRGWELQSRTAKWCGSDFA